MGVVMQKAGLMNLLFSYQGRINRAKYWLVVVVYLAIMIAMAAIAAVLFGSSILSLGDDPDGEAIVGMIGKGIGFFLICLVIYIPLLVSSVFVGIKRLHDRDKSGWWLLVFYLLPAVLQMMTNQSMIFGLVGAAIYIWALVELGFLRGTIGPNRFGPDPVPSVIVSPA
jgi:uncharacterized membrane protein YhaH (DUF805 family)